MREILFKAQRADGNGWVEGTYHYSSDGRFHYIMRREKFINIDHYEYLHEEEVFEVIPETLCQFTGLTDKNGKKIFEWDKMSDNVFVEFEKCFEPEGSTYPIYMNGFSFCNDPSKLEIIGNIHDNV